MLSKKCLLTATALTLLSAVAAKAEPVRGVYVGAGAGVNLGHDTLINGGGTRVALDPGFAGVVSLGYGFGNGIRAEIEGDFRENEVDHLKAGGVRLPNANGRIRSYGVMGNVFYDLDLGMFTPYVGAGVGYIWSDWQKVGRFGADQTITTNAVQGEFAYQGIAGVAMPLERIGLAVPGLSLTAEYRFLGTLDQDVKADVSRGATPVRFESSNNYNHSIMLGVRYAFGGSVAVPPPLATPVLPVAPAAAPARTYLVFFDWNRSDMTDRARQVVGEAAQNSQRLQSTRVEVAGHADRSGTPQFNERLSRQRGEKVAAELVRAGVDRSEITVTAFGESRPLVPTADGAREPQNRRVEIVLR